MLIAVWQTAINILVENYLIAVSSYSSLKTAINILVETYLIVVSCDTSLQTTINILVETYHILKDIFTPLIRSDSDLELLYYPGSAYRI